MATIWAQYDSSAVSPARFIETSWLVVSVKPSVLPGGFGVETVVPSVVTPSLLQNVEPTVSYSA